jgi:hypothetical protein
MKNLLKIVSASACAALGLLVTAPASASADNTVTTQPGGVFITAHDPDFHALSSVGAQHIYQKAVAYVTNNKPNPKMLLITDLRNPGSGYIDSRLGTRTSGFTTFDVADYGSGAAGVLDLHKVNFANYDVIVVASDFGGWLHQEEINVLNERAHEIIDFVNNGGGLIAFAESHVKNRFQFLPFVVAQTALDQVEAGTKVTPAGKAIGLVDSDVNSNASHCIFTSTAGLDVIDMDAKGRILTLATHRTISDVGVDDRPVVTANPDRAPNANGWYNSDVTVTFAATDTDSTPVSRVDAPVTVSTEGQNQKVTGTATDTAGLVGKVELSVSLDKTAPHTDATVAGSASTTEANTYASDVTVTLAGSDALSGVSNTEYRVNGGDWQPYTGSVNFADSGFYTVEYRSTDLADNQESVQSLSFKIAPADSTPPVTTANVSATAGENAWYTSPISVTLSATDDLSGVDKTEYKLDNGDWMTYTGSLPTLNEGEHTLDFRSSDKAGNQESDHHLPLNVDTTAPVTVPTLNSTAEPNNSAYKGDVTLNLTATDNLSGVQKTQVLQGGEWIDYTAPLTFTTEGRYEIAYRTIDMAGNAEEPRTVNFIVDKTPPSTVVDINEPSGSNGWYGGTVVISMDCKDDLSQNNHTEYSVNGGPWIPFNGPVSFSDDGEYTVNYRSTDEAGNIEATQTTSFKIDTTAPVVTAVLPSPGANGWYNTEVPISFEATDNLSGVSTIEYRINGGAWRTYTGSFTAIHDGVCTIEYRSTDDAGNTSEPQPIELKIDKTPPKLNITVDNKVLWPPNHKMIPIHVTIDASDSMSGLASVVLTSVTVNEGDEWYGDGNFTQDVQGADIGTADTQIYVRSERSGLLNDRVYTFTYTATDTAGNVTVATATVTVPHDMKKKK